MLVRNDALKSITSNLVKTGHRNFHGPGPQTRWEPIPSTECDADLVLRRTDVEHESEYHYLSLWSETTYRIIVNEFPTVEVPDVYPWQHVLVEEKWHPAIHREDGWWFGPRLHPDTKVPNLPERATPPTIFFKGLPRVKSPSNNYPILVPTLPSYLDAIIYHKTQYHHSKPGLASISSWQIGNLTRYLYLELSCQQFLSLRTFGYYVSYILPI
ncbi:hypothetical protein CC78DRAFT_579722 [Lojkania enalia]|uniref:Uncharacterized protein n=1 Tax=Lojkania enalia TaxID=147567 RepID=A0A9P4KB89_9PLEO|nr:hypothetical protein CC78DRAFT_579722 [Didymosphaeria enalia]